MKNSPLLEDYLLEPLSTLILHWSRGIEITRSSHNVINWTHLEFQTPFCPKILTWVLSSRSQYLVFYLCWIFPLKSVTFHLCTGILSDQNWQKVLLVLTCLDNQSYFFCLLHFSFNVSIDRFLLEADCWFLKLSNWNFTSNVESWMTISGKSSFSVELSWHSNSTFSKTTILMWSIKVWIDGDIFLNVP